MQPLVSIIIPTYNRAHLIGETLDSILAQTYTHWECIVVDDGSTDDTETLLQTYIDKDPRFQYHKRPDTHLPGGNGARNYGFEVSKGEYIQWFDSDDVMLPEKLELKVNAIVEYEVDIVVSKSKYLNSSSDFYHYDYTAQDISFESFSMGNVSWVTDDFIVKRTVASAISFNEIMRSGQEYNYCCKLLLQSDEIHFIDKFLTLRRDTEDSIGNNRQKNRDTYLKSRLYAYWYTYIDVLKITSHKTFEKFSLLTCISSYLKTNKPMVLPDGFYKALYKTFGFKSIYFLFSKWSKLLFGKYFYFYSKLKL
ncbi:glycosyltransferase family 2 protein [Corallibacter sp.]|uniref:glycosyltransferase family 2 protein n=1 Tax=Corallibacter sp. TaxID=2038084 RepID=UPI003A8CF630